MGMAFLVDDEAVEAVEGGNEHFGHTSLWPEHFTRFSPAQTLSLTPELTGVILYKIFFFLGLFSIVVAGAIWFATSEMKSINEEYMHILDNDVVAMKSNIRASQRVYNFGLLGWEIVAENDPAILPKIDAEIEANRQQFEDLTAAAMKAAPHTAERIEQARKMFEDLMKHDYVALKGAAIVGNHEEEKRLAETSEVKQVELRKFP